jgi:hypothetical protein
MANNKFTSQTKYEFDLDPALSKIRFDFDTNVGTNPTNSVLGLDSDSVGFVLLDQSLITGAGSNLKTSTASNDLNVKTYVFEKTVDPSVVGCENCGANAKYFPLGVATSTAGSVLKGDITDPDVLPVINKEVIAEFEIEPEAYHSFEIDLIGNRRVCNDSGNCFTEDLKVSKQEIDKGATGDPNKISWLARTIYTGTNSEQNKTLLRQLLTNKNSALTAKPIKDQLITVGTTSTYNPLNAGVGGRTPSEPMLDVASQALSVIDYSCCKCCDIWATPGLTTAQKVQLCEETNVYNVSAQEGPNTFLSYCNNPNLINIPWYDLSFIQISICDLLNQKKYQYGYYPNPDIPQCLNGIYTGFNDFAITRSSIIGGSNDFRSSLQTIDFDSSLTSFMFPPGTGGGDIATPLDSCGDWDVNWDCDCTQAQGDPNWCDCCGNGGRVNCCSGGTDPDGGGDGTGEGKNAVRHSGDIINIDTGGFIVENSYLLGKCENYPVIGNPNQGDSDIVDFNTKHVYQFQSDWCGIIPNSPSTPTLLNDSSKTSTVQNYCYLTVNDFITSFDASKQNILGLFEDVPWLTMGGHFYSHAKLRNFVYNQTGTIHFSTSVNSNFLSYKPYLYGGVQNNFTADGYNTIYHIENIRANGKEYKLDYSHKPTTPAFYKSGAAYLSIGFGYNSNVDVTDPGSGNDAYPFVKRYTFHNLKGEGGFHSEYRTNESRISFSPTATNPDIIISNPNIKSTLDRTTTNNILETDYDRVEKTYSISSSVVEPQLQIFGAVNFSDDDFSGIWDADKLYSTDDSLIILRNGGVYCIDQTSGMPAKNYCVTPWDTSNTTIVATTTDSAPASLSEAFGNIGFIKSVHGTSSPLVAVAADTFSGPPVDGDKLVCWQGSLAAMTGFDDNNVVGDCFEKRLNPTAQCPIGVGEGFIVIRNNNDEVQAWGDPGLNNQHFPTPTIETLIKSPGFIGMKCGKNHCVLLESNTGTLKVHAWGNNDFKQIEVPTFPTGTQISTPANFDDFVSCGDDHTCVILSNNTIVCWGRNGSGQCSGTDASGNAITSTFKNDNTPVQINGVTLLVDNMSKVKCSASATFSIKDSKINGVWGFVPSIPSGTDAIDAVCMSSGTSVIMRNKKIDDSVNNETILSGDIKIKWPLTDQLDKYVPVGRQSFKLVPNTDPELDGFPNTGKTVEGSPNYEQWLQFSNVYYNSVSPTDSIILSGIRRNYDRMHTVISYKHYLINNSIPQPFSFITDARDFGTGGSFESFRFEAKFLDDTTLEISDNTAQGTTRLFNKTNTLHTVTGQTPAKVLNDILVPITGNIDNAAFVGNGDQMNHTANSSVDVLHMVVNAYVGSVAGSTLTIDKTKEVLEHGTTINSYQKSGTVGTTNFKITLKLDKPFTRYTEPGSTLTPPNTNGTVKYFLVFKIKKNIKGFTDSIVYDRTSVFTRKNGSYKFEPYSSYNVRTNAGDQVDEGIGSTQSNVPGSLRKENFLYKTDNRLFSINSSRFCTPDYASYDANAYVKKILSASDEIVIPMRGLQYAFHKKKQGLDTGILAEVDDYPIMRTVRKNDGKFYIQILAGAFPYYHPLVHEPILKKIGIQGNYDLEWRNQICRKSSQWFNYVATTKWTCVVKHTQLSTNIGDWAAALPPTSSGGGTESKPIVIGRSPSTAEITTPTVPGGSGLKPDARESGGRFPGVTQIQTEVE